MDSAVERRPFRGARLLTLRQAEGLTQADLARRLGVSQVFVSKVEKALRPMPDELALAAATEYDVPLEYFMVERGSTDDGIPTFRKSSKASTKEEARVLAAFGDAARLFRSASERSGYHASKLDELREFDEESSAAQLRAYIGLGADEPILNATRAAERLGVGVIHDLLEVDPEQVQHTGISRPSVLVDRPLVATIGPVSPAVMRMTVMHELGHLVYDGDRSVPIRGVRSVEERRAYRFAGAMLLPASMMERRVTGNLALTGYLRIKADYGVSVGAIVKRAANLGIISPERQRSLFIQISSQGWRHNEPVAVAEEKAILVRQAVERGIANTVPGVAHAVGLRHADAKRWTGLPDRTPSEGDVISIHQRRRSA